VTWFVHWLRFDLVEILPPIRCLLESLVESLAILSEGLCVADKYATASPIHGSLDWAESLSFSIMSNLERTTSQYGNAIHE
jgi:hypothetical protein